MNSEKKTTSKKNQKPEPTLQDLRRERMQRTILANIDTLAEKAGWAKISKISKFEKFGESDRMETLWLYHEDGIATIIGYVYDDMDEDVNTLRAVLYAMSMIIFMTKGQFRPVRHVVVGFNCSDETIGHIVSMKYPFHLLNIKEGKAYFYRGRYDNNTESPSYVQRDPNREIFK